MLLGDDWGQPLHVGVPSLLLQRHEFEVHHFTNESYVIDYAHIVVYY